MFKNSLIEEIPCQGGEEDVESLSTDIMDTGDTSPLDVDYVDAGKVEQVSSEL